MIISSTLDQNSAPLNAVEVELHYDSTQLAVTSLEISDSLCEPRFIITKEFSNEVGRLFYQCGTTTPFVGSSTTLALIHVEPQRLGTSSVSFGQRTHLLASDGYGTSVLLKIINAIYDNQTQKIPRGAIQNE